MAIVLIAVTSFLGGCRQRESEIPEPSGELSNKTDDISRDLMAVARGASNADAELGEDLANLTGRQPPKQLIGELTERLGTALAGKEVPPARAQKLARHLFVALVANELSERQIEGLRRDITATLSEIGATPTQAESIAASVGEIQQVMGTNRRRWWQRG